MQLFQALTCYGAWTSSGRRKAYLGDASRSARRMEEPSLAYAERGGAEPMLVRVEVPAGSGKAERLLMECLAMEPQQSTVSCAMWYSPVVDEVATGFRRYTVGALPIQEASDPHWGLWWQCLNPWDRLPWNLEAGRSHLEHRPKTTSEAPLSAFVRGLQIPQSPAGPRNNPPIRAVGTQPSSRKPHVPTLWRSVNDESASVEQRMDALIELLYLDPDGATNYIVAELYKDDLPSSWRNSLILVLEDVQVNDEHRRRRIIDRLFLLAQSLRRSTEVGIAPIVHSAIRSYASMIDLRETGCLATFLEPPKPVETRLVALLCIVNMFASRPPDQGGDDALRDRVHELAIKFLDRDWLAPGEKAAIGQTAMVALAAMGDARVAECTAVVKGLATPWLTRQVTSKLEALLANWSTDSSLVDHPATTLLQDQLKALRAEHMR